MLNNKVSKAALASIGTFYAARKGFKEQTAQEVAEEAVNIQKQRFDAFKTSAGDPDAPAYNMGAGSIDEVESIRMMMLKSLFKTWQMKIYLK